MRQAVDKLTKLVGSALDGITIEVYRYADDDKATVNDVQVSIGRSHFIFGCAGDGSVFAKQGRAQLSSYDESVTGVLHRPGCYEGVKFEGIEITDVSIKLRLAGSTIELVNDDDELVLIEDGERLTFDDVV